MKNKKKILLMHIMNIQKNYNIYSGLYYTCLGAHDEFLTSENFESKNMCPKSNGYAFRKSGL